jgi:hypothetical protein
MTDNLPAEPTRQAVAARDRSERGRVTGKLKAALGFMVWEGLKRSDAATKAGLSDHGLRAALKKSHVKQAYLAECEVLRVSGRARRIHRLEELTEQNENRQAAVNAARALDLMGSDPAAIASTATRPGLVIVVVDAAGKPRAIEPPAGPAQHLVIDHQTPAEEPPSAEDD